MPIQALFFILLLIFIMPTSAAQLPVGEEELKSLRSKFLQAEASKWDVNWPSYQEKIDELKPYPLMPYFKLSQLKKNLRIKNEAQIAEFLETYNNTALEWSLRKPWLAYLLKYKKKQRFLRYYKHTENKQFYCSQLQFKLDSKVAKEQVLPLVEEIWLTGKSLPKECDKLLALWTKKGYRTNELVWQRALLAQSNRQYILVKYLLKLLPQKEQYLVEQWKKIKRDPKLVSNEKKFPKLNKQETLIIIDGINRLVWKDGLLALSAFEKYNQQGRFSDADKEKILRKLVIAISKSDDPAAQHWYQNIERKYISDGAIQWRLAQTLEEQNFTQAISEITALGKEQQQKRQWQYWLARAKHNTGEQTNAENIYNELAKQRSFYGFLAAAKIGDKSLLNHQPISIPEHQISKLNNDITGQRALELYRLKRYSEARREWGYWMQQLSEKEQIAAAKWAHLHGWYDRAIYSLSQVGALNDIDVRFPMPFADEFSQSAIKYKVDPAWAYAIARKESIFMSDATSSVGALGLMQVRPVTANYLNSKPLSRWQILDSDNNIDLGVKYLRYLLDKFDGNIVLATAAYNAGPEKVKRWLKSTQPMPADIWIETIPYKETREYVKSVMAFTEIYQQKRGQGKSVFVSILSMKIQ